MSIVQKQIVSTSIRAIFPDIKENSELYCDLEDFIIANAFGDKKCAVLYAHSESFVEFLNEHNISISEIGMKEVIVRPTFVAFREDYRQAKLQRLLDYENVKRKH